MNFETMREVLQRVEIFHRNLSAYFERRGANEKQEKIKLLLDYLSRHESNLAQAVQAFSAHGQQGVLNTWLQYTSPALPVDCAISDQMAFDEVIKVALVFDDSLLDLYRTVVQEADIPEVREVAENLLAMENEERRRRTRSIAELQDM